MGKIERYIAAIALGLLVSFVVLIEYNQTVKVVLQQAVYDCRAKYGVNAARISDGVVLCQIGENRWISL